MSVDGLDCARLHCGHPLARHTKQAPAAVPSYPFPFCAADDCQCIGYVPHGRTYAHRAENAVRRGRPVPAGGRAGHTFDARGCGACERQYVHTLPADLREALDDAAYDVGQRHGQQGAPEWSPFVGQYMLRAYATGYAAGEQERLLS